jgi:fatty acid-binding protein DegV
LSQRDSAEGYSALDIPTQAALAYVKQYPGAASKEPSTAAPLADLHAGRTLLVVDAACDLPTAWLHRNKIVVIPLTIKLGDAQTLDVRDDAQSALFVKHLRQRPKASANSESLTPTEIRDRIQPHMAPTLEHVLQISFAAGYSHSHLYALRATQALVLIHGKVRRTIGNRTPLKAWVFDSKTGLTGTALLLAYAAQLRDRGVSAAEIVPALDQLREQVHTLVVPGANRYLGVTLERAGAGPMVRWALALATLFDLFPVLHMSTREISAVARVRRLLPAVEHGLALAARQVSLGVAAPIVCLSYGGDLDALQALPSFAALRTACRAQRAELIVTSMSMTGSALFGPGALAVSFASTHFTP